MIDVSLIVEKFKSDSGYSLVLQNYNNLFGDHLYGIVKMLKISQDYKVIYMTENYNFEIIYSE